MPSLYRNVSVDLVNPSSITDHTALALIDVLSNSPIEVSAVDVHDFVVQYPGADPAYIAKAVKALRNMGYAISAVKARHLSCYMIAGTPIQYARYADRIASEHYSQCISAVRAMDVLVQQPQPDPLILAAHNAMQLSAMTLGQKCGLTLQEIVAEFQPI